MYRHSPRPRFMKIPGAMAYSSRGRTKLYEWAAKYAGLFRKDGASTIVDIDILDQILDGLPIAEIKAPANKPSANCTILSAVASPIPAPLPVAVNWGKENIQVFRIAGSYKF
jgi:hypothetical protein